MLVLPYSLSAVFLMIEAGDFSLDFGWESLLEMVGMYGIAFYIVGRGLKKYHPPVRWSTNRSDLILVIVNIIVALTPAYFIYILITSEYFPHFGFSATISQLLSLPCIFLLFLINRRITNENLDMAKEIAEKEEPKMSKKEYQRRMRLTVIFLTFAMIASIFFVVYSNIQADFANEQLEIERRWHQRDLDELNIKIDSLTAELESLKLKPDTTSSSR